VARLHKRRPYYFAEPPRPLVAKGTPRPDGSINANSKVREVVCPYCYSEGWRPITSTRAFCAEGHSFYVR
jgi:hypothetical protein